MSRRRGGRCIRTVVLFIFLSTIYVWPQFAYDLLFEGPDLLLYKYTMNRPKFLCVDMRERLGNLLFQYTFAYSMARRFNFTLVCEQDKMSELQELFNIQNCTRHDLGERVCFSEFRTKGSGIDTGYDKEFDNLNVLEDIHFLGYFQSWKYWGKYENTFRNQLTIRKDVTAKAIELINIGLLSLGFAKRSHVTLVGIHVRRGDMVEEKGSNFGYNVVTEEYLAKAKRYIRDRVQGPIVYIVASDDMNWTRQAISNSSVVFLEGNSREVDFAAVSMCDHFIMSVGTFGWWIGWHVKGIVTYYTKPFRPGTNLAKVFADDYLTSFFYPGWIGIS